MTHSNFGSKQACIKPRVPGTSVSSTLSTMAFRVCCEECYEHTGRATSTRCCDCNKWVCDGCRYQCHCRRDPPRCFECILSYECQEGYLEGNPWGGLAMFHHLENIPDDDPWARWSPMLIDLESDECGFDGVRCKHCNCWLCPECTFGSMSAHGFFCRRHQIHGLPHSNPCEWVGS